MVARKEIHRVLWFQDPNDLLVGRAENYALLRNCNLAGAHLMMNSAAHLWALYQQTLTGKATRPYQPPYNGADVYESVFLIAHDGEKTRMSRFVFLFRDVLARFPRVMATSGTLVHIQKVLSGFGAPDSLQVGPVGATKTLAHGPSGGDVVVADEIYDSYGVGGRAHHGERVLHHVLFFPDHRQSHAHEVDVRTLLETCANPLHRVNLILNSRMAEEWAQRYRHLPSP
jgi:methylglyoxal synthase